MSPSIRPRVGLCLLLVVLFVIVVQAGDVVAQDSERDQAAPAPASPVLSGALPASAAPAAASELCADFESGALPAFMSAETDSSGGANGRVQVTMQYPHTGSYAVDLDTDCDGCGGNTRQAVVMSVDLAGATAATLNFWVYEHADESHAEDGVFISDDGGLTYQRILDYSSFPSLYTEVEIDLAAEAADAGMALVDGFLIKFQGYDNFSIPTDGYSLDYICVCTPPDPLTVTAVSSGDDVELSWNDTGSGNYEVWYSINTPYFTPGDDCANPAPYQCEAVSSNSFTGVGWASHPDVNVDFYVLDTNVCGMTSPWAQSTEMGAFSFPLGDLTANLRLTSAVQPTVTVNAADAPIIYQLDYENASRYPASGVTLTETLPAHTSFDAASSTPGWQQVGSSSQYTLTLGSLAPWQSGSADFAVNIDATLPASVANAAVIGHADGVETYLADNAVLIVSAVALLPDSDGDRLPDWAETNTGNFVSPANAGTDPNNPDTDVDSINDGDEARGTAAGLDLPGMGANPLRQDILLEHDWFDDNLDPGTCAAHSHRPTAAAIAEVTAAFANAPVVNPDGSTGINMIHDYGQGGLFTGGNYIDDPDGVLAGGVNGAEFQAHKIANFAPNRHGYFHYVLNPHRYNTNSGSSGQAELPGDDLIVSLYCYGSDHNVAHTIMHELGHNLDLRHGGFENLNWKPNYNSVMNYKYQFPGIDDNCTPPGNGVLDYSIGDRITLNENSLDENSGTCGAGFPWDWNGNAVIENPVAADINVDNGGVGDGVLGVLDDYNDWANVYLGGLTDADGALPVPQEIITDQPVPAEFRN